MCHSQYSDGCLWHQGWGMTHSVCHVITPERLYLSPSAALNVLTEKQQEKETWLEKRFIQTPYPHHSFCRQHCDVSSGFSVCAPTEVQGNYWNIWMTGPSLNPRTNDAWPLQKGMGRTLLPLTDISHQRSMTSPMLVGWREARDTFGETNLTFMTSKNIVFPTHPTARINVANEHFSEMADPFNFFMS